MSWPLLCFDLEGVEGQELTHHKAFRLHMHPCNVDPGYKALSCPLPEGQRRGLKNTFVVVLVSSAGLSNLQCSGFKVSPAGEQG